MHSNEQLIQKFYSSFQKRDANGMTSCYHPQVVFFDPVFGRLDSAHAVAMWQMLCGRAKDLEIVCSNVHAGNESGSAHWEARYTFGKAQRAVHNIIDATYEFRDGLIAKHIDTFDLWRWSRMALGPIGIVLGWTPMIQAAIRKDARRGLDEFIARQPQ